MPLVWEHACLARMKSWVWLLTSNKLGVVVHTYNPSTSEVKRGVLSHSKFKTGRDLSQKKKKGKVDKTQKAYIYDTRCGKSIESVG